MRTKHKKKAEKNPPGLYGYLDVPDSPVKTETLISPNKDLEKCFSLLKDICYEINAESNSARLKELSDKFHGMLPKTLRKTQMIIKDNDAVKEYSVMLKDFQEKKKGEL